MRLDQDFGSTFSGLVTTPEGRVRALWASYSEQVPPAPLLHVGQTCPMQCSGRRACCPRENYAALSHLSKQASKQRVAWQADREEREWCAGLPTAVFAPWVEQLCALEGGERPPPIVRTLDAELEILPLSKAAHYGLPAEWILRLSQHDPNRRQACPASETWSTVCGSWQHSWYEWRLLVGIKRS